MLWLCGCVYSLQYISMHTPDQNQITLVLIESTCLQEYGDILR